MNRYIILYCLLISSGMAWSQKPDSIWSNNGEIEDAEVVIEKDRKLELSRANKQFEKIRTENVKSQTMKVSFDLKEMDFSPRVKAPRPRILKLKKESIPKLYGNQLKLGYGSYSSPYVDLLMSNKRSNHYSYGLNFNHHSFITGPVDEKNSGMGRTHFKGFGKVFGKKITGYASADYGHQFNHFYGYAPELTPARDSIKQVFNRYRVTAGLFGTVHESAIQYKLEGSLLGVKDNFKAKESGFNLQAQAKYALNDEIRVRLNLTSDATEYADAVTLNRNLFSVAPNIDYKFSGFWITAGLTVAVDSDATGRNSKTAVYPNLAMEFPVSEGFNLYGGLRGSRSFVSLYEITSENPWVQPNLTLRNLNNKIELYGGLRGKLSDETSAEVGFSTGGYEHMYFYVNSLTDSAKFDIIYDRGTTTLFKLFGELEFSLGEGASATARAELFGYDTDSLQQAWHKPAYQIFLGGKYNMANKIILKPDLRIIGGIEAFNRQSDVSKPLEALVNISVHTSYILSDRAQIFLNLDNLLGNNFERYMNYISRSFMLSAGLSYSF